MKKLTKEEYKVKFQLKTLAQKPKQQKKQGGVVLGEQKGILSSFVKKGKRSETTM